MNRNRGGGAQSAGRQANRFAARRKTNTENQLASRFSVFSHSLAIASYFLFRNGTAFSLVILVTPCM